MSRYYKIYNIKTQSQKTFDDFTKIRNNPLGYILCFYNGLFWTCISASKEDGSYDEGIDELWNQHIMGYYINYDMYKVSPEFLDNMENRSS